MLRNALLTLTVVGLIGCEPEQGNIEQETEQTAACIVTRTEHELDDPPLRWLITWDPAARVKSEHASDAADSAVRAWRYDTSGRLIAYAGFGQGTYENFQHDYRYDEQGNREDFRLSYPEAPDVGTPSSASTWMGTAYANEYDADGRLTASTATPYGPGNGGVTPTRTTFEEDAQGRCHILDRRRDDGTGERETRSYDDAGRLHSIETEYDGLVAPFRACSVTLTRREYDHAGRLERSTTSCSDTPQATPMDTRSYTYDARGGLRIETFNYASDTPNDTIRIDGQEVHVWHSIETRTPACASIQAEIGAAGGLACMIE